MVKAISVRLIDLILAPFALLASFVMLDKSYSIVCALDFLKHNYPDKVAAKLSVLGTEMWREPGSIWLRRV